MPSISSLHSIQEVAQHNTKDDCWILVDGKIYDVTTYLDDHPGGDDVLLAVTGRDATEDFEDAGHSKDARELMQKFYIGVLDTSSSTELETPPRKRLLDSTSPLRKQYWAVSVALVGISVVVGFLYWRKK